VEDDEVSREVVAMFLRDKYVVDLAEKPEDVINKISIVQYAAILLDINLGKGISGLDLIKEIRKLPRYDHVPIIAVTAYAMREDQVNMLKCGCTHYISKPFSRKELIDLIDKAVQEL